MNRIQLSGNSTGYGGPVIVRKANLEAVSQLIGSAKVKLVSGAEVPRLMLGNVFVAAIFSLYGQTFDRCLPIYPSKDSDILAAKVLVEVELPAK